MYKLILQVKECREWKGKSCPVGYKVGEKIVVENNQINLKESDRVCLYALGGLLPYITALYRDTSSDDWINRKEELQCPDNLSTVIFKISRTNGYKW